MLLFMRRSAFRIYYYKKESTCLCRLPSSHLDGSWAATPPISTHAPFIPCLFHTNQGIFLFQQQRPDLPRLLQQMHAQQLPAHAAPPIPMIPHAGLVAGAPPSSAASLLGLSGALGAPGQHPLSMLGAKPDLHRSEDVKPSNGEIYY